MAKSPPTPKKSRATAKEKQAWLEKFVENQKDPYINRTIKKIVFAGYDIVVYLDADDIVFAHHRSARDLSEDSVLLTTQLDRLQATPTDHIATADKKQIPRLIARGMADALMGKLATARQTLGVVEELLLVRSAAAARQWYLKSAFLTFLAALTLSCAAQLLAEGRSGFFSIWLPVPLAALGGALGALLFTLGRVVNVPVEPPSDDLALRTQRRIRLVTGTSASKKTYYLEGTLRVATGFIGGMIAGAAVEAGLILAMLESQNSSRAALVFLIGIVAGISERLVPSLIERVEGIATSTDKSPEANVGVPTLPSDEPQVEKDELPAKPVQLADEAGMPPEVSDAQGTEGTESTTEPAAGEPSAAEHSGEGTADGPAREGSKDVRLDGESSKPDTTKP